MKNGRGTATGPIRSVAIALICIFGGPPTEMAAQEPLQIGDRVRVTAPDCGVVNELATFEALRGDTLVLGMMNCPLVSVTRLDVHRGQEANVGKGALLGLAIGGGGGALFGAVLFSSKCLDSPDPCPLAGAIVFGAFFGLPSALIGAIAGALIKSEHWEVVLLDRLRVSLAPQPDGRFGLGVSVRF